MRGVLLLPAQWVFEQMSAGKLDAVFFKNCLTFLGTRFTTTIRTGMTATLQRAGAGVHTLHCIMNIGGVAFLVTGMST